MVNHSDQLSRTFAALGDPTRRAILARLAAEPGLSITALAKPLPIKLPAVMKHLDVLSDAGLVVRSKTGRTVSCRLAPKPMQDAMTWLERTSSFWNARLDGLVELVESRSDRKR